MTLPGWLPVAPLALAAAGGVAIFGAEIAWPRLARLIGALALAAELLLALVALGATAGGRLLAFQWSAWPAAAGLAAVLDPLSAWVLLAVTLCALLGFISGWDTAGPRARSLLLFQLLGLDGALLAADLATLSISFAGAWLLASASVAPGARRPVLAGALVLGLAGGVIFATAGTLDLASLALVAPAIPAPGSMPLTAAAFALLALFALAAALAPLALWHPEPGARVPAAGLLAGSALAAGAVYAILRLYTLVFPCFIAGPCGPSGLALPLGLGIVATGALAALAARRGRSFVACLMMLSTGLALVAVGSFRAQGLAAGMYLLMHATLAGAAALLSLELATRRGGPRAVTGAALLYGLAVGALLGAPPLSGFLGVVALLRASGADALAVWTLVLSSMLLAVIASARGLRLAAPAGADAAAVTPAAATAATVAVALMLVLGLAAGPALDFAGRTARQLLDRNAYVAAVGTARLRAVPRR